MAVLCKLYGTELRIAHSSILGDGNYSENEDRERFCEKMKHPRNQTKSEMNERKCQNKQEGAKM